MPGSRYASIKDVHWYHGLRRHGFSKARAAAISNAGRYPGKSVKQSRSYMRRKRKR